MATQQIRSSILVLGTILAAGTASAERTPDPDAVQSAALAQFEQQVAELQRASDIRPMAADSGLRLQAESPLKILDGHLKPAVTSFVVWLDNMTSVNLDVVVYWIDTSSSLVKQTGGRVYAGQVAPYILSACGTVIAYRMDVIYNGYLVGSTGAVQPDPTDGDICSDAWAISE
jgi:hypothetical protein